MAEGHVPKTRPGGRTCPYNTSMAEGRVPMSSAIFCIYSFFVHYLLFHEKSFCVPYTLESQSDAFPVRNLSQHCYFLHSRQLTTMPCALMWGLHQRKKFLSSRIRFYSNSDAGFNLARLALSGDICPNPGPAAARISKPQYSICKRYVAKSHRATDCDICKLWCHIKCGGVTPSEYKWLQLLNNFAWSCPSCVNEFKSLPFAGVSNLDSSLTLSASSTDNMIIGDEYEVLKQKYPKNLKIAHLNINSIAGFKFYEIKSWLLKGYFEVLILTETKLDTTLPDSQFTIAGYRFIRLDRTIHGGGVMIYWRSDIIFHHVVTTQLCKVEALMVKLKIGKRWLMIVGAYQSPGINSTMWNDDLFKLFESLMSLCDDVLILGDLNCDLYAKNSTDGRALADLCDLFNLDCLINEPTRLSQSSSSLIDVILTNNKCRFLSSGVLEPHLSDHHLVYTVMRISYTLHRSRKVICRSYKAYNKDQFVTDLAYAPFHVASIFDDADDQTWAFN